MKKIMGSTGKQTWTWKDREIVSTEQMGNRRGRSGRESWSERQIEKTRDRGGDNWSGQKKTDKKRANKESPRTRQRGKNSWKKTERDIKIHKR